ncbi:response regulator transcription factor [Paraburkholderia sp. BR10954]|uniref:response regulator transcription factor n=1 Tax=unclassified Paraburkholderia TaxID=2615204 RepID=UPI0034D30B77
MSAIPVSTSIAGTGRGAQSVVYVIDDDESMRIALTNLLDSFGLHVETFASPREFLAFPKADIPSCLILDVRLRGESGLAFQQEGAKSGLRMPVLFMTGYGDVPMSVRAMKAGALDFFTKPFREQDMLDAVVQALARDHERLVAEQSVASLRNAYELLSLREREVMGYVIAGLLNKQIASEMDVREVTVKIHRAQVMRKMAARSVAELVRMAAALGVEPEA